MSFRVSAGTAKIEKMERHMGRSVLFACRCGEKLRVGTTRGSFRTEDFQRKEQSEIVPRRLFRGLKETENEEHPVGRADLGTPF